MLWCVLQRFSVIIERQLNLTQPLVDAPPAEEQRTAQFTLVRVSVEHFLCFYWFILIFIMVKLLILVLIREILILILFLM